MTRTSWPALRLELPAIDRARLEHLVWATLDDLQPTAVDGDAETTGIVFVYFAREDVRASAADRLRRELAAHGLSVVETDVKDDGWAERSQSAIKAVRVGRLTIAPPWDCAVPSPSTIVIVPSMGFGTGHHPTTRLCLAALQRLNLARRSVIDIGTGSGVLAIAAIRLGAVCAVAIDTDEDALACARENAGANGVEDRLTCERHDVRSFAGAPADVVLANLTGPLLISSLPDLARLTRPGGHLIVSGFLDSEEDAVGSTYAGLARLERRERDGEWVGLTLTLS